jgi:hypothetical protein
VTVNGPLAVCIICVSKPIVSAKYKTCNPPCTYSVPYTNRTSWNYLCEQDVDFMNCSTS